MVKSLKMCKNIRYQCKPNGMLVLTKCVHISSRHHTTINFGDEGGLSVAGWACRHSKLVASRRRNAGWLICCGPWVVDGVGRVEEARGFHRSSEQ